MDTQLETQKTTHSVSLLLLPYLHLPICKSKVQSLPSVLQQPLKRAKNERWIRPVLCSCRVTLTATLKTCLKQLCPSLSLVTHATLTQNFLAASIVLFFTSCFSPVAVQPHLAHQIWDLREDQQPPTDAKANTDNPELLLGTGSRVDRRRFAHSVLRRWASSSGTLIYSTLTESVTKDINKDTCSLQIIQGTCYGWGCLAAVLFPHLYAKK